ncbi:MAG: hypothetical protein KC964_01550 [Candidatus Omnitrophica bacterium]|nr:hypothetical protein [Candidatus Omnitrophota bacterium]
MRISPSAIQSIGNAETLGRAVKEKVFLSGSVETPDILEISSLGNLASSLGATGIQALQALSGTVEDDRLESFLGNLFGAGISGDRVGGILGSLSGLGDLSEAPDPNQLIDQVENRGISGNLEYLDRLDNLFNLGYRDVPSIFSAGSDLSDEEFGVYLDSLTTLIRNGVVGTVTVEFRDQPRTVFVETSIGSEEARSPLYPRRIGTSAFPI